MIDINSIISLALTSAINKAIEPLLERIDSLEKNEEYLVKRIAALENNPAQGVDTTATVSVGVDPKLLAEASLNYLNDQEWFWEKMQRFAAGAAEAAMDEHTSTYDHDSYDAVVSDSDDFVKSDDLEDTVRDAVSNMTFKVSVS